MHRLASSLSSTYHQSLTQAHRENVIRVLTNQFCTNENIAKKYAPCVFIEKDGDGDWKIARHFAQLLHDNPVLRDFLSDLASFMKRRFTRTYAEPYGNTEFVLNEKYSYEDVCRLLNWENNVNGQNIGGYKYDEKTKTLPVFINYKKDANAISYEDQFQSRDELMQSISIRSARARRIIGFIYLCAEIKTTRMRPSTFTFSEKSKRKALLLL